MTSTFSTLPGGNILPKTENTMPVRNGTHSMNNIPEYQPFEKPRGRENGHGEGNVIKTEFGSTSPPEDRTGGEGSSSPDEHRPTRKRRRSRKGLDKKFECETEGCGKTYSRAEHLNRHRLNHNAQTVYICDQPNCDRRFVRQDLCNRHKERHDQKSKGSLLGRKDSSMYNPSPIINATKPKNARQVAAPEPLFKRSPEPPFKREDTLSAQSKEMLSSPLRKTSAPFSPTSTNSSNSYTETGDTPTSTPTPIPTPTSGFFPRFSGDHNTAQRHDLPPRSNFITGGYNGPKTDYNHEHHASFSNTSQMSDVGFVASPPRPSAGQYGPGLNEMQSLSQASPFLNSFNPVAANMQYNIPRGTTETSFPQQNYNQMPFVLGNGHPSQNINPLYSLPPSIQAVPQSIPDNFQPDSSGDDWSGGPQYEEMSQQYMAFLGAESLEGYDRSPNSGMGIDFYNVLFDGPEPPLSLDQVGSMSMPIGTYSYIPAQLQHHQWNPQLPQYRFPPKTMAVDTVLQENMPDQKLSDWKADEVFRLIKTRFNECEESAMTPLNKQLLDGDRNDDRHMLSLKNMRAYIDCFFDQFHPQIPFLHQPSFTANKTQNLLLLAIIAIGASCLDRKHDYELSTKAAELANFIAWHLRGELFNHKDFRPPGTLWMFQALLLLELYEKMYSSRLLHERAHIHHATTITLMRRGRSLMLSNDDIANGREPAREDKSGEDVWWNRFIEAESTYRAAYVAFLIDASHAEMFGHSSHMIVTELPIPLPCNEQIWSAPSGREAYRIHLNVKANVTTRPFLESIIKLMRGHYIDTDTFGRTVLMAGLLAVLWSMRQKEHQLTKLGVGLGTVNKNWKAMLEKSFDTWASQFDQTKAFQRPYYHHREDLVSESRSVLHHLAHMSMHVDVVECQIFACAPRLLSRTILAPERLIIATKWEKKIGDKDLQTSVYYALQFLHSVLMPDERMKRSQAYSNVSQQYRARDDPLLNRPWVLYFATLIVWCYGFAKEGPNKRGRRNTPFNDRAADENTADREMREYLTKFYRPKQENLDYLLEMDGLNENSGLLLVVSACFNDCRWQLLKEAQMLLKQCYLLNEGEWILQEGNVLGIEGRRVSDVRRASTIMSY